MSNSWLTRALRDPPRPRGISTIRDHLLLTAAPQVRRDLGTWKVYRYSPDPQPRLEIITDPQGPAAVTITVQADGTLRAQKPAWLQEETDVHSWPEQIVERLQTAIQERLIRLTLQAAGLRAITGAIPQEHDWRSLRQLAQETSLEIMAQQCCTAEHNGQTIEIGPGQAGPAIRLALRENLIGEGLERLTQKNFQTPQTLLHQYNTTARNQKAFRKVRRDAPRILEFYCTHMAPEEKRPRRFRTAEEVTRTVREHLRVQPAEWALFVKLGWPQKHQGYHGTSPGPDAVRPWLNAVRLGLSALRGANCPAAPRHLQEKILTSTRMHEFYRNAEWSQGDPWKAWCRLINQYLADARDNHPKQTFAQLSRVQDALRAHVEQQQPWGPASWEQCRRRSDRWHQALVNRKAKALSREIQEAAWESLLGETTLEDIRITPITTGRDLNELGYRMSNCLGSFWRRCHQGKERIFTFTKGQEVLAAGQIYLTAEGNWAAGQLEAPRHRKPKADVHRVHQQVGRLYNELHQDAENGTQKPWSTGRP